MTYKVHISLYQKYMFSSNRYGLDLFELKPNTVTNNMLLYDTHIIPRQSYYNLNHLHKSTSTGRFREQHCK